MNLADVAQRTALQVKTAADRLDVEVTGGYAGDLISAVLANAKEGNVWITWHVHPNIVAVAVATNLSGIVLVCGREPEEETLGKAREEGVPILVTPLPAFEIIGRLHGMGISGL